MDNVNLSNGNTLTLLAVQFQIMDQYGAVINKLICQFATHTKWTHHLRDNCVKANFFRLFNFQLKHPTAKWITIRHHLFEKNGLQIIPVFFRTKTTSS